MNVQLIKAIVILPGTVLVYVPAAILWFLADAPGGFSPASPAQSRFLFGIALALGGLATAVWTMRLFVTVGRGTPAPWAPPTRLVVRGPYRHVRNPMIMSVLVMLGAESLLLGSWYLAVWLLAFFLLNAVYFLRVEEPRLEQRFGESYVRYRANVPRWIPRWRPWDAP